MAKLRAKDGLFTEEQVKQLSECVDLIGEPEFKAAICLFCMGLCNADRVFLSAFFDDCKPVAIYSNYSSQEPLDLLRIYLEGAYLLDPFYRLYKDKRGDEVVRLPDISPDNFKRSVYFQKFYKAMALTDECGAMIRIGDDRAVFFSFSSQNKPHLTDISALKHALPIVASLARRHWTKLSADRPDGTGRVAAHVEAAFNNFGQSVLSPRESEIARMIMMGHSSKSIANQFENSPETIKVHRKRLYSKLGIASQGELLSIFLKSLSIPPSPRTTDPLIYVTE